jgi:hypothetical protein
MPLLMAIRTSVIAVLDRKLNIYMHVYACKCQLKLIRLSEINLNLTAIAFNSAAFEKILLEFR